MRIVPASITQAWNDGDFLGPRRPVARVTIQHLKMNLTKVDSSRLFASAIFGQASVPRELLNLKSVRWSRSVGSDVATCTIVLANTTNPRLDGDLEPAGDFGRPGYYTYNRGEDTGNRWGHTPNRWQGWLVPDRLIRTYEGYGWNRDVSPEKDTHLVQTGTWLVDDVEYTHNGLITLSCRDVGRLLLDHIIFPPVVPLGNYPLYFQTREQIDAPDKTVTTGGSFRPSYQSDSNVPYVGSNGSVYGHRPTQAFDSSNRTYWLSIGNEAPREGYSFEHIQGGCAGRSVHAVTYRVYGGPYKVYCSVKVAGKWLGNTQIPYDPNNPASAPNGSDIRFVASQSVGYEGTGTFRFKTPYANVESVRLSFTSLYNSGLGRFRYRAGVRSFSCSTQVASVADGGKVWIGNYSDYGEIVKLLLAYGGFYWPKSSQAYLTLADGSRTTVTPANHDPYLRRGRVWGDILMAGTAGLVGVDLDIPIWDKKPLMDGIAYVRDLLGFIFFIDETGAAVFRLPNVYTVGNVIGNNAATTRSRVSDVVVIDEEKTLLSLRAKLSSRNIRDHVFVADAAGTYGATAAGFNPIVPNPGLRRVGGWTDQNFKNTTEAQRMADLITVRQMFEYRTDTITITANPAIQIDDQVRVLERVAAEGFLHYVKGISSSNDLDTGQWTYDLDLHWLGKTPGQQWAFDRSKLAAATKTFLAAMDGAPTNYS